MCNNNISIYTKNVKINIWNFELIMIELVKVTKMLVL